MFVFFLQGLISKSKDCVLVFHLTSNLYRIRTKLNPHQVEKRIGTIRQNLFTVFVISFELCLELCECEFLLFLFLFY